MWEALSGREAVQEDSDLPDSARGPWLYLKPCMEKFVTKGISKNNGDLGGEQLKGVG